MRRAREFVAQAKNQSDEEELAAEEEREEEVSVEEEEVEGSDEEWLDWRVEEVANVEEESSGTVTHHAEEEDKTTGTGFAEAVAADFPRFAKGSKSGSFPQVVPGSPGSQKLLTAQLVLGLPASQKLLTAQLVPEFPTNQKLLETQLDTSASASSSQQKVKRERTGRTPGIIETRPRMKRVKKEQDHEVVPPGFLVTYGHKLRCLHYVGRCWRLPGRDIKKWDFYGQQQPSSADYDHFCKHCWSKGAVPGGDSEAARMEADSGSSSTDA